MTAARAFWRVNVFTDRAFAGNPAGVILNADGLSESQMLKLAREANSVSETVFVSRPTQAEANFRLRFFTSMTEVDLCGHATVAGIFALAWSGQLDNAQQLVIETNVGLLPIRIYSENGHINQVEMTQLAPEFRPACATPIPADIIGVAITHIAPTPGIECVSTGIWICCVTLLDTAALAMLNPQLDALDALAPPDINLGGMYAFTLVDRKELPGKSHLYTQGRFFCPPRYGIIEDPVTGTASGALGGYLLRHGIMNVQDTLFARQGVEMGRPGTVTIRQNSNGTMSIAGTAIPVFQGWLSDTVNDDLPWE